MKTKTLHPHADLIAEAAKDTSRKLEMRYKGEYHEWGTCSLDVLFGLGIDSEVYEVRFTGESKQQPKIVSSLTDKELLDAYWDMRDYHRYVNLAHELRAVADEAAQRAIEEFLTAFLHRHTKNSIAVNQAYELFSDMKEGKLCANQNR